ncbi:MAG: GntR family transcriptional regulator [Solirubrobacterales bacterium]
MAELTQPEPATEQRPSLADSAYAQLRRQILEVELWPGATFSENEIAERLELGKTPIREALLRLRLEGLVAVRPRAGYEVAPVTLRGARDSLELRGALDAEAASRACEQPAAGEGLGILNRELLAEAGEAVAGRLEADQRFHLAVGAAGGNQALAEAVSRSFTEYLRLAHLAAAIDAASLPPLPDHTELVDAIAAGEAARARELARGEARDAELRIVQALISSESVATTNVLPAASANKFYLDIPKRS